jgi:hypothetical protein
LRKKHARATGRKGGSERTSKPWRQQEERPPTASDGDNRSAWSVNRLGEDAQEVANALDDAVCNTFAKGDDPETGGGEVVRKGWMMAASVKVKREALYRERKKKRANRQGVNDTYYTARYADKVMYCNVLVLYLYCNVL